ncbi:MAG: T9SS type A sorting domain-containing protein [Bacteroidota bacterium]
MSLRSLLLALLLALAAAPVADVAWAQYECPATCTLPTCHCASTAPPDGLAPAETPQFLLLTFDDCVLPATEARLRPILDGLTNPDGRALPRTYFVSRTNCPTSITDSTDAALVRALYLAGHEIANHTERHDTDETFSDGEWAAAIDGQRRFLIQEAGLPASAMSGFRAPFLRTNPALFRAVDALGFRYEASLLEQPYEDAEPFGQPPVSTDPSAYVWPHTLDHGAGVACGFFVANGCPDDPLPGLWTIPAWSYVDPAGLDADSTTFYGAFDIGTPLGGVFPISGDRLLDLYVANFRARYDGNRAPFNVYLHASTITDAGRQDEVRRVLEAALAKPDVWAITMDGLIAWMQDPVPASEMTAWFADYCSARPCPEASVLPSDPSLASVYPNPTAGDATLQFEHEQGALVTVEVYDVLGRQLYATERIVQPGTEQYVVPLAGHAAGTYLVRLRTRDGVLTTRLVAKQ